MAKTKPNRNKTIEMQNFSTLLFVHDHISHQQQISPLLRKRFKRTYMKFLILRISNLHLFTKSQYKPYPCYVTRYPCRKLTFQVKRYINEILSNTKLFETCKYCNLKCS
jgi:hypothetical protein